MELKCTLFLFGLFLLSRECEVGFKKENKTFVDQDECVPKSPCGENAQCFNTHGGYYCICNEGFKSNPANFTATTGECVDINECLEKTFPCSSEKKCVNTIGSFRCLCPEGYRETRLDSACEDVDECLSSVCGVHSSCTNTLGSFFCTCSPGFDKRENGLCADIDECSDPDVCGTNADCYNHPGGYSCRCHQGYSNYGNNQSKCIEMEHFCQ